MTFKPFLSVVSKVLRVNWVRVSACRLGADQRQLLMTQIGSAERNKVLKKQGENLFLWDTKESIKMHFIAI